MLLFDSVECKISSSNETSITQKDGRNWSQITTEVDCSNIGLRAAELGSMLAVKKHNSLRTTFYRGDTETGSLQTECPIDSEGDKEQVCKATMPRTEAQGTSSFKI